MNDTLPTPQPDKMITIEASLLHGSLVEAMKSGDYDTFCKVFEALGNDPDIPLRHSYTPWMLWKKVVSDIKLENSSSERSCQAQPWVNHQIEARLQDAGAGSTQWLFAMVRSCGADALIELARNHASSFTLNARDETGRTILDLILDDANLAISDDAILRLREVGFRFGWQPIPYSKPRESDCSNNALPHLNFSQFNDDTIFAHARFSEDSPQKRFWRERILDACQLGLDLDQSVIVFTSEYEPTEDFDDPQEPIYNIVPVKESDLWSGKLDAEIEVYAPFLKSEPTTARHLLEHDNLLSFAPTRAADRAP